MRELKNNPGILILGASGGVGQAVLQLMPKYRKLFSSLVLLDQNDFVIKSKYIDHKDLNYIFIKEKLRKNNLKKILRELSEKYNISIVLDVTDNDTFPILSVVDSLGLSYLNCSLNSGMSSMESFVRDMRNFSNIFRKNVHVLSMGMNPGIIHHLIVKGVLEHGVPDEFIEIEYDSGRPLDSIDKPFITWSKKQFLNEAIWSPTGYCDTKGEYKEMNKKAIDILYDTKEFLSPIQKMSEYPLGMLVPHDEVIAMSSVLEIPGKFIYAIHPDSLSSLLELAKNKIHINESDIVYLDNVERPLLGSDCVGVWLKYSQGENICYFFNVDHKKIHGTNATLFLVAVGVMAGLIDFIQNPLLENGVMSVLDLNNENFLDTVSSHVQIKKIVGKEVKNI